MFALVAATATQAQSFTISINSPVVTGNTLNYTITNNTAGGGSSSSLNSFTLTNFQGYVPGSFNFTGWSLSGQSGTNYDFTSGLVSQIFNLEPQESSPSIPSTPAR